MADQFNDHKKLVKNQLFSPAVTGGTLEDYSQNVVLFPAPSLPAANNLSGNTPAVSGTLSNSTPPIVDQHHFAKQQQQLTSFSNAGYFTSSPLSSNSTNSALRTSATSTPLGSSSSADEQNIGASDLSGVHPFAQHQIPTVLTNPLHLSDPSNLVHTLPITTNSTTSRLATTAAETLDSCSLVNVGGPKGSSYSPSPPVSTIPVPEIAGSSKNVYRLSRTNKLSYAQVPGLLTSTHTDVNRTAQPLLISNQNSYLGISVPPPNNSSFQENFQSKEYCTHQSSSLASIQASESSKDCKASTTFNTTPLFAFGTTSGDQQDFSIPLAVSNTSNASSSILNPVVMSDEAINKLPEMLLADSCEALPNNPVSLPQKCRPVYHHWFFRKEIETSTQWQPFSMLDSLALEQAFTSSNINPETVVSTDGGRFDVNVLHRERFPIYWNSTPNEVRRCSWFHKGPDEGRFTPFEESVAILLEENYTHAFETNTWNLKIELSNGESMLMVGPDILLVFPLPKIPVSWDNEKPLIRPKIAKRGMDEFDIYEGESEKIDHLLLLVHGIGSVCDLKFRSVEQVVDEFRNIASQLLNSHYQRSHNKGVVHRIEVLPISWHSKLHSEDTGIDTKLKNITLSSIPRLRDFTNDTLLDILLYTSPLYCQTIISSVGGELNRIFDLFKSRNPSFEGRVSLGGHSLGSLILFDLLCNQKAVAEENVSDENNFKTVPQNKHLLRRMSSLMFEAGSGQPQLIFPDLNFQPTALFAIGSPIGMFLTIRGLDKLGDEFSFPTCGGFFNIFHPYDPVAYRIEPLINPQLAKLKPVLIPHHKGRKRMHLELKDTVSRVGADLKHKLIDSVKTTWNTLFQTGLFARQDNDESNLEVDAAPNEAIAEYPYCQQREKNTEVYLLNKGRRIDYVLQEAPFEIFNEYLFALTSHVCYWESEDTILLILKEIYNSMGVSPDSKKFLRQQGATSGAQLLPAAADPSSGNQNHCAQIINKPDEIGMDPTMPISSNTNIRPPPKTGFVRSST